jgi:hypothetical protein
MLYESANELDARKLFLGHGSKLLDLLHQRLYDLQFLISKLVPLRHLRSKNYGGSKFLKSKVFASGGLILGIIPFRPPARVVFGHLKIKVGDIRVHLAAKATSMIAQGVPDGKNPTPKRPMGLDPQKRLTKHDKTCNVQNHIGIHITKLNPIREKKAAKKRVRRKRESAENEGKEDYPEAWGRLGDDFLTGDERLHQIILEYADLLGVG